MEFRVNSLSPSPPEQKNLYCSRVQLKKAWKQFMIGEMLQSICWASNCEVPNCSIYIQLFVIHLKSCCINILYRDVALLFMPPPTKHDVLCMYLYLPAPCSSGWVTLCIKHTKKDATSNLIIEYTVLFEHPKVAKGLPRKVLWFFP
ncbi:hypothetical protein HELRODRAFT_161300 [Helobdella robusta]|uniref:Uncharacterized protein n=1 Tax=Helobdella robusta TaxID=6412 RepID=T1ERB3_HELRO|nr:hypothetical protein HELRODRAFT_161300 [Helobdella robusta]ESO02073.1 hypothetical protein HELRODRAFT_161300 [Helobdella robusta]